MGFKVVSIVDCIDDGDIEIVENFKYLGSTINSMGEVSHDVKDRVANASRAFGILRKAVFNDKDLHLKTKAKVYSAVVLSRNMDN